MTIRRIVSLLLTLALIAALALSAGCKGGGTEAQGKKAQGEVNVEEVYGSSDLSAETIAALQNSGEITLYTDEAGLAKGTLNDDQKATHEWFKQYYGLTIKYRYQAYGDDLSKFMVDFAANDAPDMIGLNYRRWPKAGNRQVVYNMSELKKLGVVGLDHPEIVKYQDANSRFTIDGKLYSVSLSYISPVVCMVNLDLFDQYKVKSPVEYYKEGVWNFDTYLKCCKEITRTLADGTKIWGSYAWNYSWYLVANDCRLVGFNKDDKLELKMNEPKTVETLTWWSELHSKGYCPSAEEYSQTQPFMSGKMGMNIYTANNLGNLIPDVTFKWDIVPMPYGANNTSGMTPGEITGTGVVTSTKNPQGVINYVIAKALYNKGYTGQEYSTYYNKPAYDVYNEEQLEMINSYTDHVDYDLYMGVGNLNTAQWNFWNDLKRGTMTVKEVFDTYEGVFEEQVQAENAAAVRK